MEMKCGTLIPYLYACWKFDLDLATLHVAPFLLEKFAGGADLMAPGIIIPPVKGSPRFFNIFFLKHRILKIIGKFSFFTKSSGFVRYPIL